MHQYLPALNCRIKMNIKEFSITRFTVKDWVSYCNVIFTIFCFANKKIKIETDKMHSGQKDLDEIIIFLLLVKPYKIGSNAVGFFRN